MARSPARAQDPAAKDAAQSGGSGATAPVTFLVGVAVCAYLFLTNPDPKSWEAYQFINTALCLWLPLLTILLVLKQEPTAFGVARGDRKQGLRWALVAWIGMLLLLVFALHRPEFHAQYLNRRLSQPLEGTGPVFDGVRVHPKALAYYELGMGFYFFCWEFFFRGFLLFGLQKSKLGTWGAVIVQALLFMLLHWSLDKDAAKPYLEIFSAFPGGILLGILAVRTRSFLYGYLAHWAISVTLDVFLLAPFLFRHIG